MNEQALQDAYNLFVSQGYKKSIDDFKQLIATNPEALNDSYSLFKSQGYNKSVDDYKNLLGVSSVAGQPIVKKKVTTALPSEVGSVVSSKPTEDKEVGFIGNLASSLDKAVLKGFIGEPIKALGTFLEWGTSKVTGGSGKAPISDALIKFGTEYNKIIDELTPQDEEFKGTLTDQFGQAFGQLASLVATQGAAGLIGNAGKAATALEMAQMSAQAIPKATGAFTAAAKELGKTISAPASVSAGLAMGQSEFERAKEAGATDEQAYNVFLKNLSVGSVLEAIPVMGFLKRFNKASAGGVVNYLKTKAVGGLVGGTEEMTTEVMQQLYANQTAKDIYNTNQDLFEGVAESGGVGFGVGFLLNAMGANAKILRKEGKNEEADVVEQQIKEFEQQAKNGGPSSYAFNGIKIQPLQKEDGTIEDPTSLMTSIIDNMDGNELAKANIEIVNDPALKLKMQDKIVTASIKEQVRQGNPELNEPSINAITELEKELRKLEGNTTQTGKDKAAAIRAQIKNIQENQLQEEAVTETIKSEQDAIQKQAAGQVPVQPTTGISQEVEGGKPQAKLEGITEEGETTEVNQKEVIIGAPKQVSSKTLTEQEQIARMEEMFAEQEVPDAPPVNQGTSVTNKSALDQVKTKLKDDAKISIVESAQRVLTTLQSVLPNFDIVVHDTDDSYEAAMGSINATPDSAGNFSYVKMPDGSYVGRIDINLNRANQRTVGHEVAHGVMLKAFGESPETFKSFKNRIASVLSESSNKQLSDFASQYAEIDSYEEYLAELTAALEQQEGKIDTTTMQRIAALINELVSKITNGAFTPFQNTADTKEAVEFFRNISESIRKGEAIKEADIAIKKKDTKEAKAERKSKAQIIGRNAQLSATAKFNLNLAEEMDKNKMPAKDIRLATGWEKGLDKKWRYEIPDGKFKDIDLDDLKKIIDNDGTAIRVSKLGDIFDAPDLYQAYPEIKDINVRFKELPPRNYGSFNIRDKVITVNKDLYNEKRPEAELTMLHEMQHYIQNVELFERGSNQAYAPIMMKYIINDFKSKVDAQKKNYDELKKAFPDNKEAIKNYRDLYKSAKEKYEKVKDLALQKQSKETKKSLKEMGESAGVTISTSDIFGKKAADAFNLYYRVAGEVEARNVENRSKLTPEERRKTMLAETENIDREDQIMFDNSELLFTEEVQNLKEEFPVSKAQLSNDNKVSKLIKDARAQGFSEAAIETFLKGKGFSTQQINAAMGKETEAAGRVALSEEMLPGYTNLMAKVDSLIKKGDSLRGVLSFLKNSNEYINATDIQKEKLVRELRKKLGIREKSAPTAQRLLGLIQDVTKITLTEKQFFTKQIKDLARGAKDAKKLWRQASSELTKELKELASSGKITAKQLAAVLRKFSSVDMFKEKSIEKFVDYMEKVFSDAEYASKLDFARSTLKTAKKNIATKIGIADGLYNPLNRLFSVDPSLIPDSVLDKYLALVDMFGKRQAVLDLAEKSQVKKVTEDILDAIAEEQSLADELADRFNESPNKLFSDDGKLDFAQSLKEMVKEGEITEAEADIMRKYKSDILPQVESKKMTEQEIAEEKEGLIREIEDANVDSSGLPTADERSLANQLRDLIKTKAIDKLNNTDLKNLLKVISNINNNYLPHFAQVLVEKMNAINEGEKLSSAVGKAKLPKLSTLYAKFKNLFTGKGATLELVRRSPLYYIDQVFGNFKTKDIYNSLLKKAAQGEARFTSELKKVQNILERAEEKVAKSFDLDGNDTLMSKFKMMTYMIQLEYDSNVGDKQVNPAADYLKATIKHIDEGKSQFGERDAEMLQDILNKYGKVVGKDENGKDIIEIDNQKLYDSFNKAEKDAIKDIRGINESLRGKAEYTAAIIRGDKISPLNNYVHLNVLHETQPNELTSGSAFITEFNNSMRPSTKAKSLIARTGKVSPLNFDVFASAQRGAKFVLMDYNLTEPIRTARKTLNQALLNLEEQGRIPKENRQVFNAIRDAFEEAVENLLTNSYISNAFLDNVIDYINKQGYRAVLAGTSRFVSELSSNISFAIISDPSAFKTGYDNRDVIMSTDAPTIMSNVGSTQTSRIFPTDTLSGKLIDTNVLNQANGIKGGKAKGYIANKIQQLFNRTGKKYLNTVELTADALISTPDKIVMRPIWFGSFANEFKKITGKDVNFDKIAANDEAYMSQNKEAIDKSKNFADERSVFTGASDNAFMGILKGTPKPNQSGWLRAFNNFNNFMTRFLIFEYATARAGINAAIGNGSMTKKEGAALVAAVTTRMMVYSLLTQALGNGLMGLFFDDEEEENDDTILQNIGQAFASAFSSIALGRDFGNATKLFINEGVERANEEYLDFLRTGEYDRYEDNIQNSLVPQEKKGRQTGVWDYVKNMGGAFTPILKTTDLIIKNKTAAEPKTAEAIKRREKESNIRIPLEIAGNLGLVPMYKDIRKAAMNDIYKDLDKNKGVEVEPLSENQNDQIKALRELKQTTQDDDALREINKKIREIQATGEQAKKYEEASKRESEKKKRLLYDSGEGVRYDNPSEMKRYNPRLYNERFGPESDWYQTHKAEADIEKAMNKEIRKMEDEEFQYTPNPKNKSGRNSDGTMKRTRN